MKKIFLIRRQEGEQVGLDMDSVYVLDSETRDIQVATVERRGNAAPEDQVMRIRYHILPHHHSTEDGVCAIKQTHMISLKIHCSALVGSMSGR